MQLYERHSLVWGTINPPGLETGLGEQCIINFMPQITRHGVIICLGKS